MNKSTLRRQAATSSLDYFNQNVPYKPYCTDDFQDGLLILPQEKAFSKRYIQHNQPYMTYFLVFDVDRQASAIDWYDRDCPTPNLTIMNPVNAHSHLLYALLVALCTSPLGSLKVLKYAAGIERALCLKLGADVGYSGLICKNPNHAHWRTTPWRDEPYELGELADYLDLSAANAPRYDHDYGLGRNCTLFEKTRKWAYRAIRRGWPDYRQWFAACFERAMGYNIQFPVPLSEPEVHHLGKSVAGWTHKHFTEKSFAEYVARTHTPKIQAVRGAKANNWHEAGGKANNWSEAGKVGGKIGGKLSKRGAVATSERTLKPWEKLGISRAWYYQQKKLGVL